MRTIVTLILAALAGTAAADQPRFPLMHWVAPDGVRHWQLVIPRQIALAIAQQSDSEDLAQNHAFELFKQAIGMQLSLRNLCDGGWDLEKDGVRYIAEGAEIKGHCL